MRITILGGGVMGEIITRSILNKHIVESDQLVIADIDESKRRRLSKNYGVKTAKSAVRNMDKTDLLIICLKPQGCGNILENLRGRIKKDALVISSMAGIGIKSLQTLLGHKNIVRSMPNIPARIGEGMTVWYSEKNIPHLQILLSKMVFQSFGKELEVFDENMIDAATAISGSGPAYIFYVAEKLISASESLGFGHKESLRMIRQTFQGAMDLWDETSLSPGHLRQMVTSEKGTTEAAISCFEKLGTGAVFNEGVNAAYKRAKELGKETGRIKK